MANTAVTMARWVVKILVINAVGIHVGATPGNPVRPDYRWANPEAVERWHDMKFGLRIHWGEYAVNSIGPESWPLNKARGNQTFLKWYWDQYKTWNPKKYNADDWIALMKRSGVKFFDFTTKHHEGFSMYDTNTRVHDCWNFDLTPGAQKIKGIVPCVPGSDPSPSPGSECKLGTRCMYSVVNQTKSTGVESKCVQNVTVGLSQALCDQDSTCAGFDYFHDHSNCGVGCACLKQSTVTTIPYDSNTLYVKQGNPVPVDPNEPLPPDGIAYSSMEAFGRDVTGELVAAARKGGIIPGLYFSNIDWFDPDMRIDQWNAVAGPGAKLCAGLPCDPVVYNKTSNPEQWGRFVLRHRAQVMEVLTKYGEICEASFDMNFPDSMDEDITDTFMLARQLAPNTLFRGRGMGGKKEDGGYGDYDTPEETFPDKPIPGNWQVIYHGSAFMSYDPDPSHYVNGSFILWHLVDIVAKGGLMQIGYGPDRDGEFHPLAVAALEESGRWLNVNGEAIYSTRAMPLHWNDTISTFARYTRSKDNSTVYAIALVGFGGPTGLPTTLQLACVIPHPGSAITLLGHDGALNWTRDPLRGVTSVSVPSAAISVLPGPGYTFKILGQPSSVC